MKKFKSFLVEHSNSVSSYDPSIKVVVLHEDDYRYDVWKPIFEDLGHAIGIIESNTIIWDGKVWKNLSKEEVLFAEAHEAAHFKLGENSSEIESDWLAVANLWYKGFKHATKVGIGIFEDRNGMEFDTDDLQGYDGWNNKIKKDAEKFIKECKTKDLDLLSVLKNPDKFSFTIKKDVLFESWNLYSQSLY